MSRRSSRRKRRARAKRLAALGDQRLWRHLTKCPEKARQLPEGSWYVSNASAPEHPSIWMTCKSCNLTYYNEGDKIHVPGKGTFSEPPDALQILALLGSSSK